MTDRALTTIALLALTATLPAAEPATPKPAEGTPPESKQVIEIRSSNGFEYDLQKGAAVYTGDVKVEDPSMRLNCHQLTVKFMPKKKADPEDKGVPLVTGNFGGAIESITAIGSVVILNKKDRSTASGEQAVYTTADETIVLSGGRPSITSGNNGLRADRVIFDRRRGKFRAEGRIESYLVGASLFNATTQPPLKMSPR